ncbi:AAA family ATPase [Flavobacterium bizetiae]|uniref:AAA family ATPase n=1 Tax=Flavobacterium bizetiae TaxID=2704140 RepID=UPI0037567250
MISKIRIQNFKSLEDVTLECSNLNVLTGLNGMGKSSVIQALLLLRQSYERGFLQNEGLSLNGDLTDIGTGKEALYQFATTEEIVFSFDFLKDDSVEQKEWFFAYETYNPDNGDENKYSASDFLSFSDGSKKPENLNLYPLFKINTFNYLNADRWVKNEYEISDLHVVRSRSLGKHGEYTSHYLNHYGTKSINSELLFPGVETNELLTQVSAWLSQISPGTKIIVDRIKGANSVKLRYIFDDNGATSDETTPLNVGFGITYVLPVIVSLLSANVGDLLIIENPESHIHPKGQSIIGNLMAKVAQLGVQIFVETHSDHILNGIRVAVKKGINADLIRFNFFIRGSEKNKIYSKHQTPKLDQDGRVDIWPDYFFDEWDNNLLELL